MLDIEHFLTTHFEDVGTYGNPPTDYKVDCPFCEERIGTYDTKGHMNVSMDKQAVHCFRCGYSKSWIGLVMDMTGLPYFRAIGVLYSVPHMTEFESALRSVSKEVDQVIQPLAELPKGFKPLAYTRDEVTKPFRMYLRKRGFSEDIWKRYNLGSASGVPGRIIIPIEDGYWQGRTIYRWMNPKYMNPKVDARAVIFNSLALSTYNEAVICEGAFSAMAVGLNAVALIGKEPTKEKLQRLVDSNVSKYIIALEPNAFGTMEKLADTLQGEGKEVTIWNFLKGDPAEKDAEYDSLEYGFRAKVLLRMQKS